MSRLTTLQQSTFTLRSSLAMKMLLIDMLYEVSKPGHTIHDHEHSSAQTHYHKVHFSYADMTNIYPKSRSLSLSLRISDVQAR